MQLTDKQFLGRVEKIASCADRDTRMQKFLNERMAIDAVQVLRLLHVMGMRPVGVDTQAKTEGQKSKIN